MTTSTNITTTPVPPGAEPGDWQELDGQAFRILYGPLRPVPGCEAVTVSAAAVQFSDGRIDNGDTIEPPTVSINAPDRGLTADAARCLAVSLIDSAAELDAWADQPADWRALAARLTPAQMRHLGAVEELAVETLLAPDADASARLAAQEIIDGLGAEAAWYSHANPEPGVEDDRLEVFRDVVRVVNPAELTTSDLLAVVSLLQRSMTARGPR